MKTRRTVLITIVLLLCGLALALPPLPADPSGQDAPPPPPMTAQEMMSYVGVYSQGARRMEIVARDGRLLLRQGTRETELRRTDLHRFTPNVFFVAAADGRVEYLHSGGRSWKKIS